ncbi:MAG: TIM barrel protein, partial [Pirellulales bacterium]
DYLATIRKLANVIGLERVQAFHLNDSKRELGSRVDRHAHIGEGQLGLDPFRRLLNDPRFGNVPMYLETPKGRRDGLELDVINLATLRGLVE